MRAVFKLAWAGIMLALAFPAQAALLEVTRAQGERIYAAALEEGARWCVHWNHSVEGFLVRDCYRVTDGHMMLERSHQPDFAAGLGYIPGRGEMTSAPEGGYWIENINEFMPGDCYRLRVGARGVDHTIVVGNERTNLSAIAPRERVVVSLRAADSDGGTAC